MLAYTFTASAVDIFQCVPVEADWNPAIKARCVNFGADLIVLSAINVVTDFIILCLPLRQVWQLYMDNTRKIQLSSIFLLGSL